MKKIVVFVLSLCLVLALLTASLANEVPPEAKKTFTPPAVVPAKEFEDFIGEWLFYVSISESGKETSREQMLVDGLIDEHVELTITESEILLYTASTGKTESVEYEFLPEDGSLQILNVMHEPPVFRLADNGMLSLDVPAVSDIEGLTAYFTRKES